MAYYARRRLAPSPPEEHGPMKTCPFCAEEIQDAAVVCKHCGRDLATGAAPNQTVVVQASPQRLWSPGIAALLSLVLPGAGQIYKGQVGNGLVWLICVVLGYALFIFPGLILHLLCIAGAAQGDPYARQQSIGRAKGGPPKPPPVSQGAAYGCHECGKTVRAGNTTCKHCGAALV